MFDSVRFRLTLWYVGVLSVTLMGFSLALYVIVQRNLYQAVDSALASTLQSVSELLAQPDELSPERAAGLLGGVHLANQAVAVIDSRGTLLAEKGGRDGIRIRLPPLTTPSERSAQFYSLPERNSDSDDSCRGIVGRIRTTKGAIYSVVVNQSLEPVSDDLDLLEDVLFVTVPSALAMAGLGGWFLARRSLQPVVVMSAQARRISAENLDERLPIKNSRDELGTLAATFNALLARLSDSFHRQRRFMADASHELRTPLSVIRTTSTVTLQRDDRSQEEYREALTIVEQESQRLSRIVNDMFLLARVDARQPELHRAQLSLDELILETLRAARTLAMDRGLRLDADVRVEAPCLGDRDLLQQMLWNLLDNAIKYTPHGGSIRVSLTRDDAGYRITVADTGIGIAAEAQPHIFERFFRASGISRSDTVHQQGAGLGLPIARWIAEIHRGHLELQHSDPTGSTFAVSLPHS